MASILPSKLLSVTEAADFLGSSRQNLYKMMRRGELAWLQVGGRRRFDPRDLEKYIERQRVPARGEPSLN